MKYYKIISHYVVMETHEIPAADFQAEKERLKSNCQYFEEMSDQEILESMLDDEYLIKSDSRDFEIVDFDEIEEEEITGAKNG